MLFHGTKNIFQKLVSPSSSFILSAALLCQGQTVLAAPSSNKGSGVQNSTSSKINTIDESVPHQLIEKLLKSIDQKQAAVYIRFKGSFQPLDIQDLSATLIAAMDTKGQPIEIKFDNISPSNNGNSANDLRLFGSLDIDQRIIVIEVRPANSADLKEFVGKLSFIDSKTQNKGSIFMSLQTPQIDIQDLFVDEVNFRIRLPENAQNDKGPRDQNSLKNQLFKLVLNCKGRHQARNPITRKTELNDLEACEFELSDKFYVDFKEKLPKLNY